MTEAAEPIERRAIGFVNALLMLAVWALLVWHHLDPGGPQTWFQTVRGRWLEWRAARSELSRTLDDILDLPETEKP